MLISYTQDSTQERWKGYVYAVSMFIVSVCMSVIIHQYWQIVFVLGMRIRTAIIGMVYAKVQRIYIHDQFTNCKNTRYRLQVVSVIAIFVPKQQQQQQ